MLKHPFFCQITRTATKPSIPSTSAALPTLSRKSSSFSSAVPPKPTGSVPGYNEDSPGTSPAITKGPIAQYNSLVHLGTLRDDPFQRSIVRKLQKLHDQLEQYHPPDVPEQVQRAPSGLSFSRLFSSTPKSPPTHAAPIIPEGTPKGLYLYGSVGTGKSMLMDLFYHALPPHLHDCRRRIHFHAFMIDVHKRNHAYKVKFKKSEDRMPEVARDLAREARILCFDEFQVTDITDAMILRGLLEKLMAYGVVCIMTSNRHPDELYKGGLQRESFIPCIELIKERFEVTDLDGETDYRRVSRPTSKVYYSTHDKSDLQAYQKAFDSFVGEDTVYTNKKLEIWGRNLNVPESTDKVAKFKFEDICGKPVGAADYLEITKKWPIVFVQDVPKMNLDSKDRARRFITFIDACYESQTKLYISSDGPIFQVFSGSSDQKVLDIPHSALGVLDDLGVDTKKTGNSTLFNGEEEVFAWARCVSRLTEMGSKKWVDAPIS